MLDRSRIIRLLYYGPLSNAVIVMGVCRDRPVGRDDRPIQAVARVLKGMVARGEIVGGFHNGVVTYALNGRNG